MRRIHIVIPAAVVALTAGMLISVPSAATTASTAPPDARITFLAELPHRTAALERTAQAISTPGNPQYRQYLTVAEAAKRFGATDAAIAKVRAAARRLDLRADIDPTRLVVRLTGTVAAWEKAMGQTITYQAAQPGSPYNSYGFPLPPIAVPSMDNPQFWQLFYLSQGEGSQPAPAGLRGTITRFVPAYNEYVPAADVTPAQATAGSVPDGRSLYFPGATTQTPPTNPAAALMGSCINQPGAPIAQGSLFGRVPFSPSVFVGHRQVFDAYGITPLQRSVGADASDRVTIISLGGGFSDQDLADAAACFGFTKPDVRFTFGTGVASRFVNVNDETTLDVQTVSSTLGRAKSIQLVQVAPSSAGADFVDGYTRALTAPVQPHAITLSYGNCEPLIAKQGLNATLESVFQFAAVIGTTISVSSGDGGSSVCQEIFGQELIGLLELLEGVQEAEQQAAGNPTELAEIQAFAAQLEAAVAYLTPLAGYARATVAYPASSPYAMAVGGTQIVLNADGSRAGEVVWNDQPYAGGQIANLVGTGGPSASFDAPWYQQPRTRNDVRLVPDISAMAGPAPGLPVVFQGAIAPNGGTSQSSPMMAAAFAMLSAREAKAGRAAIGFPNPWLYDVVKRRPSTVYDVTIGDNQFAIGYAPNSSTIPACCQADLGYDLATGLGVPQFNELVKHTAPKVARAQR